MALCMYSYARINQPLASVRNKFDSFQKKVYQYKIHKNSAMFLPPRTNKTSNKGFQMRFSLSFFVRGIKVCIQLQNLLNKCGLKSSKHMVVTFKNIHFNSEAHDWFIMDLAVCFSIIFQNVNKVQIVQMEGNILNASLTNVYVWLDSFLKAIFV